MSQGYTYTNVRGVQYHLNTKVVKLRSHVESNIYYFSKDARDTACALPEGKIVVENNVTGLPMVKKAV